MRNPLSCVVVCAAAICVAAVISDAACAQDWSAAKAELAQKGITPSIIYEGDVFSDLSGGARRGSGYIGNLYLELLLDGERLFNAKGLTAFVSGLGTHGNQPGAFAGDAQGVSDMAAPNDFRLYEAWVQQNSFDDRFSVLAGRFDLNTEFYRLTSSGLFLNSSFGIGPELAHSGVAGPSIFPSTSLGFRAEYKPAPNIVLRTAVLDGVPVDRPDGSIGAFKSNDGLLIVSEAAFLDRPEPSERQQNVRFRVGRVAGAAAYNDKIAFGGWYYTASFNDLSALDARGNPVRRQGNGGAYMLMERALYRAPDDPKRRVTGFVELGIGDDRVNRFGSYVGSGLVATGVFPNRPIDELGFAFALANNGSHYLNAQQVRQVPTTRSEMALELAYLAQITHSFAIQPDIQYVMNPNTDPSLKNALVFQLRFEVSF